MIQNEYDLNDEVQLKLVALLVREPVTCLGLIEPRYFTNPICLDIARVAKEAYTGKDLKSVRLEEDSLRALVWETLKEHHRPRARELKKIYMQQVRKVFEVSLKDKEILLAMAGKFALHGGYREALIDAEKDLNAGRYDRILKRIQDVALPDAQLVPSVKLPVIPLHRLIYGEETTDDVDNHLVYPIIPKGGSVLLYGLPKELKSWFAAALVLDVACGRKALGFFDVPRPVKTLYVQVEDPQFVTQQRLKELARNQQSGWAVGRLRIIPRCPLHLTDPQWLSALTQEIAAFQPGLVVFDVFRRLFRGNVTDAQETARFLQILDELRDICGSAVLLAHHAKKGETSAIQTRALGREKGSVHKQVSGLRKFVKEELGKTRKLIAGKYGNPAAVRAEPAWHIEAITLLPEGEGGQIRYKGSWKLLGDTDGAEGQNRTGYAGLFRAALYR